MGYLPGFDYGELEDVVFYKNTSTGQIVVDVYKSIYAYHGEIYPDEPVSVFASWNRFITRLSYDAYIEIDNDFYYIEANSVGNAITEVIGGTTYYIVTVPARKVTISTTVLVVKISGLRRSFNYDGQPHTASGYEVTNPEELGDYPYQTAISVSKSDITVTKSDAGTWFMGLSSEKFTNTDSAYNVEFQIVEDGRLVIYKKSINVGVIGNNVAKTYDGQQHSISGCTYTITDPMYQASKILCTKTARRKNYGTTYMLLQPIDFENIDSNYEVTFSIEADGFIKINKRNAVVLVTTEHNTYTYDKQLHSAGLHLSTTDTLYNVENVSISGEINVSRTDVGTSTLETPASKFSNTDTNFNITFSVDSENCTVTITPATVTVTISGKQVTAKYDGLPHTASGHYFESSKSFYTEDQDVSFTGSDSVTRTEEGISYTSLTGHFININQNCVVTFNITEGFIHIVLTTYYVGKREKQFDKSPITDEYTHVNITSGKTVISAAKETDNGRLLEFECPWATQQVADNILASLNGFRYKPFDSQGTTIPPHVEIGDSLIIHGVLSQMFSQKTNVDSLFASDCRAPFDEEIEHEFHYKNPEERKMSRYNEVTARFILELGRIATEMSSKSYFYCQDTVPENPSVSDMWFCTQEQTNYHLQKWYRYNGSEWIELSDSDLGSARQTFVQDSEPYNPRNGFMWYYTGSTTSSYTHNRWYVYDGSKSKWILFNDAYFSSQLTQQDNQITAKVSKTGGVESSFGWNLLSDRWELKSDNQTVFLVNKDGATVEGTINAKSGSLGGWTLEDNCITNGIDYTGNKNTNATGVGGGGSGRAFWAGDGRFQVDQDGRVTCSNLGIHGGTININNKFIVDAQGNITSKGNVFAAIITADKIVSGDTGGKLNGNVFRGESIPLSALTSQTAAPINNLNRIPSVTSLFSGVVPFQYGLSVSENMTVTTEGTENQCYISSFPLNKMSIASNIVTRTFSKLYHDAGSYFTGTVTFENLNGDIVDAPVLVDDEQGIHGFPYKPIGIRKTASGSPYDTYAYTYKDHDGVSHEEELAVYMGGIPHGYRLLYYAFHARNYYWGQTYSNINMLATARI